MVRAGRMTLLSIGLLLSSVGLADDARFSNTGDSLRPASTVAADSALEELLYVSNWELLQPIAARANSNDGSRPISDLNFQDSSTLARASRIRGLSLLTLGQFGQSRLFLGVNDDGIAGIHFNAFPRFGDDTYLELVRMPYLTKDEADE